MSDNFESCKFCDGMIDVSGLIVGDYCLCEECFSFYCYEEFYDGNEKDYYPSINFKFRLQKEVKELLVNSRSKLQRERDVLSASCKNLFTVIDDLNKVITTYEQKMWL